MGRPSLAPQRRGEILDALERFVLRDGLPEATLARVAAEAGIPRSLISHYFGTREALLAALFDRILARRQQEFEAFVARHPPERRLDAGLDYLFGGPFDEDRHGLASTGEMLALAARDPAYADDLRGMYRHFTHRVEAELARARPGASRAELREAAYAIVCLAEQHQTLSWLGLPEAQHARARRAAAKLIDALAGSRSA